MDHFLSTRFEAHDQETQERITQIVGLLEIAYFAELETAMNYISILNNLSGVEAEPVKNILRGEIEDEFRHAQEIANRIRVLGFKVPSAMDFRDSKVSVGQEMLGHGGELRSCIRAVVSAESEAMSLYKEIIDLSAEIDPVTADMVTELLADEEDHYRTFNNLL
jgi:bacterioferritin